MDTKKRFFGRFAERAQLDLYVNKIIGDEPHLARVRDISTEGLYLYKLIEPVSGGEGRVGLEMKLPTSEDVIWAVGEVVRNEAGHVTDGVAVRFVRITEHDRKIIADYVAAQRQPMAA